MLTSALAWADVPPPPDMSDYDRDAKDEIAVVIDGSPLPVLPKAGAGETIELLDWDDDAWS